MDDSHDTLLKLKNDEFAFAFDNEINPFFSLASDLTVFSTQLPA